MGVEKWARYLNVHLRVTNLNRLLGMSHVLFATNLLGFTIEKNQLTFSADEAWEVNSLGVQCDFDEPYNSEDAIIGDKLSDWAEMEGVMWPKIWKSRYTSAYQKRVPGGVAR